MRDVGDILHCFLESPVPHFIEQKGQQNGQRESQEQGQKAQVECIADRSGKVRRLIILQKPLVPGIGEGTSVYALHGAVFLEGQNHARHGHITEDKIPDKRKKKHRIKLPVFIDAPLSDPVHKPFSLHGRTSGRATHIHIIPYFSSVCLSSDQAAY